MDRSKNIRYLVIKHWQDLVFSPEKNVLKKSFQNRKDAENFIKRVQDKDRDPSNSVDFMRSLADPLYEKEKEWWKAEEFKGFYKYDIIEIEI